MRFPFAASCAAVVLAAAAAARADTLKVPSEDYPLIQDAVDAAGPGDVVLIGPGTYDETISVSGKTDLTIRGRGRPVIASTSTIFPVLVGGSSGVLLTGFDVESGTVTVGESSNVTLVNLRMTGSGQNGFFTSANDGVLVSRCRVEGFHTNGVFDFGSTGLVVEKCRIEGLSGIAVYLGASGMEATPGAVVSKNRIVDAAAGVNLGGPDNVVEKNRMEGLTGYGIVEGDYGSDGAILVGNRIETTGAGGISAAGTGAVVSGNTLEGAGLFWAAGGGTFERNRVNGVAGVGLDLLGDGSQVTGNQVRDSGGDGIRVTGGACAVSGNRVSGAGGIGLLVDGSPNGIAGNRVSGSATFDLADTSAAGANTYDGNRFGISVFNYVIP